MSAAAATAAGPADPGCVLNTPQDRDQWFNLSPARFSELCEAAYLNGDSSYVSSALRANHERMKEFIERQSTAGTRFVNNEENNGLILMARKINSLLPSVVNRNMYVETESKRMKERFEHLEDQVGVQKSTSDSVSKIAESIAEGKTRHHR